MNRFLKSPYAVDDGYTPVFSDDGSDSFLRSPSPSNDPYQPDADIPVPGTPYVVHDGDTYTDTSTDTTYRLIGGNAYEMYNPKERTPRMPLAREATEMLASDLATGRRDSPEFGKDYYGARDLQDTETAQGNAMEHQVENLLAQPYPYPGTPEAINERMRSARERAIQKYWNEPNDPIVQKINSMPINEFPGARTSDELRYRPKGVLAGALSRGVDILQQDLYGTAAWAGRALGSEDLQQWGEEGAKQQDVEMARNPAKYPSYKDVASLGSAAGYIGERIGESLPSMLPALAGGVAGAALSTASKAKTVLGVSAEAFGAAAGSWAGGLPTHLGEIEHDQESRPNPVAPSEVLAGAAVNSALDTLGLIPAYKGIGEATALAGTAPVRDVAKQILSTVATEVPVEGVTEAAQQATEIVLRAEQDPTFDPYGEEARSQIIEAGVGGAAAGLGVGVLGRSVGIVNKTLADTNTQEERKATAEQAASELAAQTLTPDQHEAPPNTEEPRLTIASALELVAPYAEYVNSTQPEVRSSIIAQAGLEHDPTMGLDFHTQSIGEVERFADLIRALHDEMGPEAFAQQVQDQGLDLNGLVDPNFDPEVAAVRFENLSMRRDAKSQLKAVDLYAQLQKHEILSNLYNYLNDAYANRNQQEHTQPSDPSSQTDGGYGPDPESPLGYARADDPSPGPNADPAGVDAGADQAIEQAQEQVAATENPAPVQPELAAEGAAGARVESSQAADVGPSSDSGLVVEEAPTEDQGLDASVVPAQATQDPVPLSQEEISDVQVAQQETRPVDKIRPVVELPEEIPNEQTKTSTQQAERTEPAPAPEERALVEQAAPEAAPDIAATPGRKPTYEGASAQNIAVDPTVRNIEGEVVAPPLNKSDAIPLTEPARQPAYLAQRPEPVEVVPEHSMSESIPEEWGKGVDSSKAPDTYEGGDEEVIPLRSGEAKSTVRYYGRTKPSGEDEYVTSTDDKNLDYDTRDVQLDSKNPPLARLKELAARAFHTTPDEVSVVDHGEGGYLALAPTDTTEDRLVSNRVLELIPIKNTKKGKAWVIRDTETGDSSNPFVSDSYIDERIRDAHDTTRMSKADRIPFLGSTGKNTYFDGHRLTRLGALLSGHDMSKYIPAHKASQYFKTAVSELIQRGFSVHPSTVDKAGKPTINPAAVILRTTESPVTLEHSERFSRQAGPIYDLLDQIDSGAQAEHLDLSPIVSIPDMKPGIKAFNASSNVGALRNFLSNRLKANGLPTELGTEEYDFEPTQEVNMLPSRPPEMYMNAGGVNIVSPKDVVSARLWAALPPEAKATITTNTMIIRKAQPKLNRLNLRLKAAKTEAARTVIQKHINQIMQEEVTPSMAAIEKVKSQHAAVDIHEYNMEQAASAPDEGNNAAVGREGLESDNAAISKFKKPKPREAYPEDTEIKHDIKSAAIPELFNTLAKLVGLDTKVRIVDEEGQQRRRDAAATRLARHEEALSSLKSTLASTHNKITKKQIDHYEELIRYEKNIIDSAEGDSKGHISYSPGFSDPLRRVPTIFISSKLSEHHQAIVLVHEFGHLVQKAFVAQIIEKSRKGDVEAKEVVDSIFGSVNWDSQSEATAASERFAHMTERWATTTAKPMNAIERFFKSVGDALKQLWLYAKQRHPDERSFKNFSSFMDALMDRAGTEPVTAAERQAFTAKVRKELGAIDSASPTATADRETLRGMLEHALQPRLKPVMNPYTRVVEDIISSPFLPVNPARTPATEYFGGQLYNAAMTSRAGAWLKSHAEQAGDLLSKLNPVVLSLDANLASYNSATADWLRSNFHHRPNDKASTSVSTVKGVKVPNSRLATIDAEIRRLSAPWRQRMADLVVEYSKKSEADRARIGDELVQATAGNASASLDPFVKQIQGYFESIYKEFNKGDYNLHMKHRDNYYRLSFDYDRMDKPDARDAFVTALMDKGNYTVGDALEIFENIRSTRTSMLDMAEDRALGPGLGAKHKREFSEAVIAELGKQRFYSTDIPAVLNAYTHSLVKAAVWRKRFGGYRTDIHGVALRDKDGKLIFDSMGLLNRKLQISQATDDLSLKEIRYIKEVAIPAYRGALGANISPQARAVMSWTQTYFNIAMLPFAIFSNIADLASVGVKEQVYKNPISASLGIFKAAFDSLKSASQDDYRRLLYEDLGMAHESMAESILSDASASSYMLPLTQKINYKFFELIQMKRWNEFIRTVAAKLAVRGIQRMYRNGETERLAHLGLDGRDVKRWVDAGTPIAGMSKDHLQVAYAIDRYINEAVIRPNASLRPGWASDPHFSLLYYLKSFMWAQYETTGRQVFAQIQAEHGLAKALPVVALAAMALPLAIIGYELRKLIGEDLVSEVTGLPRHKDAIERFSPEYYAEMLSRSGVLGPADLVKQMYDSGRHGQLAFTALGGPVMAKFIEIFDHGLFDTLATTQPLIGQSATLRDAVKGAIEYD